MNKALKRIIMNTFLFTFVLSAANISNAAVQTPEKVRIGLFFESTASSAFTVNAEKGVEIGELKDDAFTLLYEEAASDKLTVRKDAYYVYSGNCFTEFKEGQSKIPAGEKYGPYHVKINVACTDLAAANKTIADLSKNGIAAYPVYADGWQVWTGFYLDQVSAQADMVNSIEKKLGKGAGEVIQPAQNRIVALNSSGKPAVVFGSSSGVFRIRPKQENNPYIFSLSNGRKYRGELEVRRFTDSDMTVINILPFEQYLYGVVPSEMESYSDIEALKAQAVASRTYAVNSMGRHGKFEFDMCDTPHCHVYKGFSEETKNTNKAVDETKSKIVTYNGKPAAVFYFSSSGGMTESNKNVWGYDYPYLKSVEDKYESGKSYNYIWEKTFTAVKIKEVMTQKHLDLGEILGLNITKKSDAGRATELIIKGSKSEKAFVRSSTRDVLSLPSQWYNITTDADINIKSSGTQTVSANLGGKTVMTAGGLKTLASGSNITVIGGDKTKKTVPSVPTVYKFSGRGWGHAIGMSQEGAKGMAGAGFKYEQILVHYFPGTKIE